MREAIGIGPWYESLTHEEKAALPAHLLEPVTILRFELKIKCTPGLNEIASEFASEGESEL